jgi:hypothetical protein
MRNKTGSFCCVGQFIRVTKMAVGHNTLIRVVIVRQALESDFHSIEAWAPAG